MSSVTLTRRRVGGARADALVLPFFHGLEPGPGVGEAEAAFEISLRRILGRGPFRGRRTEHALVALPGPGPVEVVLAVGLGERHAGTDAVRDAASVAAAALTGYESIATTLGLVDVDGAAGIRAAAEGFVLGAHRFERYRRRPVGGNPAVPVKAALHVGRIGVVDRTALTRGSIAANRANWVRDLVHTPAADATPTALAEEIALRSSEVGIRARIRTGRYLERAGFGGVLGVGRGSRHEPRLVELIYDAGSGDDPEIALTGKGVTFDSGGLNLKRDPEEIAWMKADMAGAAAVAGAMLAAAEMELPVRAVAMLPFAENMPGAGALHPGDILTHRGGRTSEVVDTDSEGRLLLADTLARLAERRPAAIIDAATLTDAGGIGHALWAVMGTNAPLVQELLRSGEEAGEPGWALPLRDEYRGLFASQVADLRNVPAHGPDTAVMAGMFLREFAGDVPWAHIDNGSTAWMEYPTEVWPVGPTGSPMRAVLRFLERLADRRGEFRPR